mgnify:CR=1 FL=1
MKYARFPFEKIVKKSRVVLYGAGRGLLLLNLMQQCTGTGQL